MRKDRTETSGGGVARDRWRSHFVRYAQAMAIMAVAVGLRAVLAAQMGKSAFVLTLVGMLVAAWVGGLGPCLVAQTLALAAEVFIAGRPGEGRASPVQAIVSVTAYYAVGITVALLSDASRHARRWAQAAHAAAALQREQLAAILECMGDGVLVTDGRGRVMLMNPVAELLLGWTLDDAAGRRLTDVFAIAEADGTPAGHDLIERVLKQDQVVRDHKPYELLAKNGRSIPVSYSAAPVSDTDNRVTGVVLVFRDETERRRAEDALREADKRKDEFLATLAHELRNPLAPIRTGLELMRLSKDNPTVLDEVRVIMERQTQHMSRLIDDLLDVSRITRGKLQLKKDLVDLQGIVRTAVDAAQPSMGKFEHEFVVRLPERKVLLHADSHRLMQVFTNLLDNAAKYTPRGGRIELAAERSDGKVIVTVSDTGIGIPAAMRERIFDLFTQVDRSIESAHSGLGIGLTLVKRLLEMHDGRIEVASNAPEPGSTFTIHLPVLAPVQAAVDDSPEPEGDAPSTPRRRILVVDDNNDALESLGMLVRLLGHEVAMGRDGLEAVEAVKRFRPEVVLMDLGMPNLNGYDAAKQIRELPNGGPLLLVATTGWGHAEDRERTRAAGFDHHLVKPIDPEAIRQLLDGLPPQDGEAEPRESVAG